MRKYIQPNIEVSQPELIQMAGLSKNDGQGNQGDYFTNESLYDEMEDAYPPKDKGLWEE